MIRRGWTRGWGSGAADRDGGHGGDYFGGSGRRRFGDLGVHNGVWMDGVLGFGIMQGGGGWAWTRDQGGEDGLEG